MHAEQAAETDTQRPSKLHPAQSTETDTDTEPEPEIPPRENKRPSEEERGQVLSLFALLVQKSINADTCEAGA